MYFIRQIICGANLNCVVEPRSQIEACGKSTKLSGQGDSYPCVEMRSKKGPQEKRSSDISGAQICRK